MTRPKLIDMSEYLTNQDQTEEAYAVFNADMYSTQTKTTESNSVLNLGLSDSDLILDL